MRALARTLDPLPPLRSPNPVPEPPMPQAPPPAQAPEYVSTESISQRMARLAAVVAREPEGGNSVMALEDLRSGLDAFCRGAGIDPERLPADAQGRILHLAGRLVREAFVGLRSSSAPAQRPVPATASRHRHPEAG